MVRKVSSFSIWKVLLFLESEGDATEWSLFYQHDWRRRRTIDRHTQGGERTLMSYSKGPIWSIWNLKRPPNQRVRSGTKIDFLPFVEKMKHSLVYLSDVYSSSSSGCPSVRFHIWLFINHRRENLDQRVHLRIPSLLRLGEQFPIEFQLDEKQSPFGANEAHRSRLLVCAKHLRLRSLFFHLGILF